MIMEKGKKWLSVLSILIVVAVWQILSFFVPPLFLPGPITVVVESYNLYHNILWASISTTIFRVIAGFFLGSVIGIFIAILMSWNKDLLAFCEPIVEILRPVPVLALIPLFILWFGLGETGKILLIATGSFVILVVNTREAIRNVKPEYIQAARTLGASKKKQIFRTIILRAITPEIIGGIRVAAAASFGLAAAAEFLGAQQGIGYIIIQARRFLYTHGVIFGILLFSLLSWVADTIIRKIDARINRWTQRFT
jgi:ABC-type nitrate/sulfonate/bicarbonate transport system permease component